MVARQISRQKTISTLDYTNDMVATKYNVEAAF